MPRGRPKGIKDSYQRKRGDGPTKQIRVPVALVDAVREFINKLLQK